MEDKLEEHSITTPRGKVAYLRVGDGPPLLLLAGLGSRIRLWGELPVLLARQFTVLAMENRGMGGSREGSRFTLEGVADDAAAVIDDAGIGPAAVLGVSMGGATAVILGARRPDAVSRLVVASCAARLTPSHRRVVRFFQLALERLAPAEAAEMVMTFAFAPSFTDRYGAFVDDVSRLWAPDADDVPGALAQAAHLLAGFDIRTTAAAVSCPTLVVAGAVDPIIAPEATAELAAAIPGARLLVVPGAAHSVLAEGGPAVLDDVTAFLAPRPEAG